MATDRYQRHSLIDWFSQDELRQSHVAVIGAGAIGNEVLKNLALLGVGTIDVYDFDRIETHNLTRSVLFRESDVGRSKAECAAARTAELDPSISVNPIEGDVWRTMKLDMVRRYTAVVCCVDNFEARIRTNQLCRIVGINLVNVAIDSRFASVEVFPFSTRAPIACYECNLPASVYKRIAARYSCGWLRKAGFVERKVPTTIVTSSAAAALAVSSALRLGQVKAEFASRRVLLDTIESHSSVVDLHRNEHCAGCALLRGSTQILRANPHVDSRLAMFRHEGAACIRLSDQLIVGGRCKCGFTIEEDGRARLRRASDFDDSITRCPVCEEQSVVIEIRDQFEISELVEGFADQGIPAKFALLDVGDNTVVFDLEGSG